MSAKRHAKALRDRCARQFSEDHGISVSELHPAYGKEGEYNFEISGYDMFEFRGRDRHETVWSARVYVSRDHHTRFMESSKNVESVPEHVLDCALEPLTASDYYAEEES